MSSLAIETRRRVDRWFFISVGLSMIVFNIIAFAPSIIEPSGRNVPFPVTPLVASHVIVSLGVLLLFLAQATLVATGRIDVHRRLGIAGAALAAAFLVLSYLTTVESARRGFDLSGDLSSLPLPAGVTAAAFLRSAIVGLPTFGILVGAGLYYRHRPDVHKRLMLLAMLGGLSPTPTTHVIGRWPALQPWLTVLGPVSFLAFLSLVAIYDLAVSGRIHPVTLWGAIAVFVSRAIFFVAILPSAAWNDFVAWLIR